MELKSVGQVILTRKLQLKDESINNVIVNIGKPQKFPDSTDYYCPYQIIGMGSEQIEYCGGIDEIQAVLLSMERIGTLLVESNEYKENKLSWIGSDRGNLGFPVFDSAGLISDLGLLPDDR